MLVGLPASILYLICSSLFIETTKRTFQGCISSKGKCQRSYGQRSAGPLVNLQLDCPATVNTTTQMLRKVYTVTVMVAVLAQFLDSHKGLLLESPYQCHIIMGGLHLLLSI